MKNIKNEIKNQNAITLIALVITIVVLIILASVAINLSLGQNGLFTRAKTATEEYTNAQNKEEAEIAKLTNEIESYAKGGTITAADVSFTPTDPTWTGITNVKQALDSLYNN